MDYPLAKDLKDAGFPQDGNGRSIVDPRLIVARRGDRAYVPTLEELIEACGERFASLARDLDPDPLWTAIGKDDGDVGVYGKTPTEAVARLWLALNKK